MDLSPEPQAVSSSLALPQELFYHIIDFLRDDVKACKACSLVCKSWVYTSHSHVFRVQDLSKLFRHPIPHDQSILRHIRVVTTRVSACEALSNAGGDFQCMPLVNNLQILGTADSDLSANSIALLHTIFPNTATLTLGAVSFLSSNHLLHFLASFSLLSAVFIRNLPDPQEHESNAVGKGGKSFAIAESEVRGRAPRSLHSLHITTLGPHILSVVLRWLAMERYHFADDVSFSWLCRSEKECSDTRQFFQMIEGSVRVLTLWFCALRVIDVVPAFPDLSKCPKLQTLVIVLNCSFYRTNSPTTPTWIQDTLENTPFPSLHTITFQIQNSFHAPKAMASLKIDEKLSSPRFGHIRRVVVRVPSPAGVLGNFSSRFAELERNIRVTLPCLDARGILHIFL